MKTLLIIAIASLAAGTALAQTYTHQNVFGQHVVTGSDGYYGQYSNTFGTRTYEDNRGHHCTTQRVFGQLQTQCY